MREWRWRLNYDMDVFLRRAAYRATHGGANPPLNSQLWTEHVRLWEDSHRTARVWRWLGRQGGREPEWRDAPPLERFSVVKPFLRDDYTVDQVMARLETWPMIKESRLADRDPSGEWFLFVIEVLAESRRAAAQIVECIFMLETAANPEVG
ncbi:MAG TPA: hypothetical protein VJ385_19345 [Fibrobacteria bacterium]|nr:hypothetical protein [Fibrobacteria bacterium]